MRSRSVRALAVCALVVISSLVPRADTTVQTLPFSQNWTDTGQIAADDNWSGVPGIVGYRGDSMASATAVDPQTVLIEAASAGAVIDVNANLTTPNTFATGGVAEFQIPNPVIALQGSGTARAPHIVMTVSTTGMSTVHVAYNLRDIDGSADNAVQPVALQFRVGTSGNYTNVPAAFVADASSGPNLATLVTPVSVDLPAAAANQPIVQIRVITTDAIGSDEWIGIDDITITGGAVTGTSPAGTMTADAQSYAPGDSITLTVNATPGANPDSAALVVTGNLGSLNLGNPVFINQGGNVFTFTGTIPDNVTGGSKSPTATVSDTNTSRTGTASLPSPITIVTPTVPGGSATAAPPTVAPGGATTITVNVTPGVNPTSTNIAVTGDLTAIGGSAAQPFLGSGNTFTLAAIVAPGTTDGVKAIPITISDAQGRSSTTTATMTVSTPAHNSDSVVVISQIYGGGGNTAATFHNDYIELYNRGAATIDLTGWSVQYASAAGSSWTNSQLLNGPIAPGEYLLIALASGGTAGLALPEANVSGDINMSGTTGKVALVDNAGSLSGVCPVNDAHVVDFVGYGTGANCQEGATRAPAPSNSLSIFRREGGATDTDENGSDFSTATPAPRRTAPIAAPVELGPTVSITDPAANASTAPRDATIQVSFSEPVDAIGAWFDITCVTSGQHNDATFAGGGQDLYITPNRNFTAGEQCTVTIFKDQIHDQDPNDSAPNTDTLAANYVWSFSVATGTLPPFPPSVHLTMGNPNGAVADLNQPNNYLMEKDEFALSYNRDFGRPNWVSWHLSNEWVGSLVRVDSFRPDPAVPPDWYRVQAFDFVGSGFDRGHMTPNADRDKDTSIPINQATFLMSNMVAQAPGNNQGPWAALENYLRSLLPANEIYIVAGGQGTGGTGSNGGVTNTLANGHVTVPNTTWKVALVIPAGGGDDISRVTCTARTIAVIMPNEDSIRNTDWTNFLTTVDAVEALTGYNLFSNLPEPIQRCVEAGINGVNPPLVKGDQTIDFAAPPDRTFGDLPFTVSATGGLSGNPVTFAASGACSSSGVNGATITIGSAGFCTITASQAGSDLYNAAPNVARTLTVARTNATITVTGDSGPYDGGAHGATGSATGVAGEDLNALLHLGATFTNAPGGTAHWTFDGNSNYAAAEGDVAIAIAGRALTVVANNQTRSHTAPNPVLDGTITGLVSADGITVTFTTTAGNVPGAYPITPVLLDPNGKLGNYFVSLTDGVMVLTNAAPVAVADGPYIGQWNTALTIAAKGVLTNDTDADGDPLTATLVTGPAHGTLALNVNGGFTYTPAADFSGADSFTYQAADGLAAGTVATVSLTITSPCSSNGDDCRFGTPIARDDLYATGQEDTLTVTTARDVLENDGRFAATAVLISGPAHGTVALNANGSFVYVPAPSYFGLDSFLYSARSASGVAGPVATVRLIVRKNLAPDADNDFYAVKTNATLTVAAEGVLKNDSDPDDDALMAALVSGPLHGTLTLSGAGGFVYKPAANFSGTDTFTYQAADPFGHVDTATVSIKVSRNGGDDDHHGDESHHHDGDGCDHERGRNGHFRGDRCEHDRR